MAKRKTRKKRQETRFIPRSTPSSANAQSRAAAPVSKATPQSATPAAIAQAQSSFAEEYRYVIGDLKRIGILAAAMFALLVVLALLIR